MAGAGRPVTDSETVQEGVHGGRNRKRPGTAGAEPGALESAGRLAEVTPSDVLGPFRPGPGGMPPYLAGREAEKRLFRALLQRLRAGDAPPSEVVLYGPRGNGKTVLLHWLRDAAASRPVVDTVTLLPSGIPDVERLASLLRPRRWWEALTPREVGAGGVTLRRNVADRPLPLEDVLAARVRSGPLLLVMDEAHTLETAVGRALLNASQEVGRRSPLLLVLAGTPNLPRRLGAMGASFWDRARQLRIGRLDEEATAEAFRRPLRAEGIEVGDGALSRLVEQSHGYPYFVQLLGSAVWEQAIATGGSEVTVAVLEGALEAFEEAKRNYYRHRFEELEERGLLGVGRAVALAFESHLVLRGEEVRHAVEVGLRDADPDAVRRATGALRDLGFLWGTSGEPAWEPGIPSLMEYVLEFAPAP